VLELTRQQSVKNVTERLQEWQDICSINDIIPNTGVCALVKGKQIAIFRVGKDDNIYALSNYDPFSKAYVLSRGIIGDKLGKVKVASPIYKQNFDLETGQCLDDENIQIPIFPVRLMGDRILLDVTTLI
ncbi:MAG TPA: nitrite reductase small subunit NirD, partial [Allocoleopsis sp.]